MIPRKAGDRMKTNRRDAVQLARLLRAGELTAVRVPDEAHEAMRDLARAREAAVDDLRRKRQVISALLLQHGRVFPGKKTWGATHSRWLQEQSFTHPAQRMVLQEVLLAERPARERMARIEAAIAELLPSWSLAPVVETLPASVQDLAWQAQTRLRVRYRALAGFVWAIGRAVKPVSTAQRAAPRLLACHRAAQGWRRGNGRGDPRPTLCGRPCRRPQQDRAAPGRTSGDAVPNPRIRA